MVRLSCVALGLAFLLRFTGATEAASNCQRSYGSVCEFDTYQVTRNGAKRELQALTNENARLIVITKLLLRTPSTSTPPAESMRWLLELVGSYFTDLDLSIYHEKALILTEHTEVVHLSLSSARQLQLLIITGTNWFLEELVIIDSRLETIPRSIANLTSLRSLSLMRSKLRVLELGLFCQQAQLETLLVDESEISTIRPANPNGTCSVQLLRLNSNRLTSFDAALLVPLKMLQYLFLAYNQIDTFLSSAKVSLTQLQMLDLRSNNLTRLRLDRLQLPALSTLYLADNNLTSLPIFRKAATPALESLDLSGNVLGTVDLKYFGDFKNLASLDLSHNRLTSLQTSQATLLPKLRFLTLDHNLLENLDPTNWYFPRLASVTLRYNRLQAVPSSIYRGNVSRTININIDSNPIRCSSMAENVDYVMRLRSLFVTWGTTCTFSYYTGLVRVDKANGICCVE